MIRMIQVIQKEGKMQLGKGFLFRTVLIGGLGLLGVFPIGQATASSLEVFHADSLAGPMKELKKAFEGKHQGITINLNSGVSKQLAERILKGDTCDVFAPSSPAVIEEDLMKQENRRLRQGCRLLVCHLFRE